MSWSHGGERISQTAENSQLIKVMYCVYSCKSLFKQIFEDPFCNADSCMGTAFLGSQIHQFIAHVRV